MKFAIAFSAAIFASTAGAFTQPWETPVSPSNVAVKDSIHDARANDAMSQYEAALRAATAPAAPQPVEPQEESFAMPNVVPAANPFLNQVEQQVQQQVEEHTFDQYEAAIRASGATVAPPAADVPQSILFGQQPPAPKGDISKAGARLVEHIQNESLRQARGENSTPPVTSHFDDDSVPSGDISKAGARLVEQLQNDALRKARNVKQDLSNAPAILAEDAKTLLQSEDVKKLPIRTFRALANFLGSEEVKNARDSVVKNIVEGMQSEELKAVQKRAAQSFKEL